MFLRTDPQQDNYPQLWVIDYDNNLAHLRARTRIDCSNGVFNNYPAAQLIDHQLIYCNNIPGNLNTDIYQTP